MDTNNTNPVKTEDLECPTHTIRVSLDADDLEILMTAQIELFKQQPLFGMPTYSNTVSYLLKFYRELTAVIRKQSEQERE